MTMVVMHGNELPVVFPDDVRMKVLGDEKEEGGKGEEQVQKGQGRVVPGDRPNHFLHVYQGLNEQ